MVRFAVKSDTSVTVIYMGKYDYARAQKKTTQKTVGVQVKVTAFN